MKRGPLGAVLLALSAGPAAAHGAEIAAPAPEASALWLAASAANLVMMVTFVAIAIPLWRAIYEGNQLFSNPLLTGFALIFSTCAVSHGLHFEHTLIPNYHAVLHALPFMGGPAAYNYTVNFGLWSRVAMTDPTLLAVDVVTASLGIWYFLLRKRQSRFFEGAELAEDLEMREREAQAMHDDIVEEVSQALLLIDTGQEEEARERIGEVTAEAQAIVDDLLEAATLSEIEAGDLVQEGGSQAGGAAPPGGSDPKAP